jgi:hypothetical protein
MHNGHNHEPRVSRTDPSAQNATRRPASDAMQFPKPLSDRLDLPVSNIRAFCVPKLAQPIEILASIRADRTGGWSGRLKWRDVRTSDDCVNTR